MNYKTLTLTLLLGLATHTNLQAEEMMHHKGHDMSQTGETGETGEQAAMVMTKGVMTKGVITRLDEGSGKVGIKHEAIANLKMPPMTMVFMVTNPAQLKGLKVGDAILFHAENHNGKMTITHLQPQ